MYKRSLFTFILLCTVSSCFVDDALAEEYGASMTDHFKRTKDQSQTPCSVCPKRGICVPKVQCPAHVRPGSFNPECYLLKKVVGVCCYTGQRHASESDLLVYGRSASLGEEDLKAANMTSKRKLNKFLEKTKAVSEVPEATVETNHPSFAHHLSQVNHDILVPRLGYGALRNMYATKELKTRQALKPEELNLGITDHTEGPYCPEKPFCYYETNRYRTPGGECNNEKHLKWGAAKTGYERLLPPAYHDGTWSMRRSVKGKLLPSPRLVTTMVFDSFPRLSDTLNMMFMQFGQFIAHDVSATVMFTIGNNSAISCCTKAGDAMLPVEHRHYACAPISIEVTDAFYTRFKQRCMNFVRALLAPSNDCKIGYGNQMNGATHFLDLSHLYGTSMEKFAELRGPDGELKVFDDYGRPMLPLTNRKECVNMHEDSVCFNTGDHHGNQIISLTILHTIFTREHNRIARALARLNPGMDDDQIFMEARRIVQAEYQHIVYNEWLPFLLGHTIIELFDLNTAPTGYGVGYDEDVNPSVTAEFASAAMRFGHSVVDGKLMALSYMNQNMMEAVRIPQVMFQPDRLRIKDYMDAMMVGMSWEPMQRADMNIDDTLTKYLFHGSKPFGLDLAAINIQRGRDFGIRSYNDYRRLIGLPPLLDFDDYNEDDSENLYMAYADPEDVDLFVGGLSEVRVNGGAVGLTFAHIIADQFSRLKRGDRYYYEYGPDVNPGAFSLAQLTEIRKVTLSRILCDNSDGLEFLAQPWHSFLKSDYPGNKLTHCKGGNLPEMDLSKFSGITRNK